MIIVNGTIEVQSTTGGGLDERTGFPRAAATAWGNPIGCQYSPVKQDYLSAVNGEPVKTLSYSILIEEQPFAADRVRLSDRAGNVLGEFSVISVEALEAVCQIRITV